MALFFCAVLNLIFLRGAIYWKSEKGFQWKKINTRDMQSHGVHFCDNWTHICWGLFCYEIQIN
jgi:hypothetical protein